MERARLQERCISEMHAFRNLKNVLMGFLMFITGEIAAWNNRPFLVI
jgi:hypothetical protein